MSSVTLLTVFPVFVAIVAATGFALLRQLRREREFAARVALAHGAAPIVAEHHDATALRARLTQAVAAVGQAILRSGLLPSRTLTDLERTLESCGLHGRNGLGLFIGLKIMMLVSLPVMTVLVLDGVDVSSHLRVVLPAIAGVVGLLVPDWVVGHRRKRVMEQLELGLPDALDMMVICAQAGLGLGATIIRVGAELGPARPEIAREFLLTANDLQIMADSRVALANLGARTGLESIKRLVTALIQATIYGTPLTEALRQLSAEMRQETLIRFESRAARLPVLLTLPTVVFILPCVFLIVGGPAIIQVVHLMSKG
jgi:tight adherence protein C